MKRQVKNIKKLRVIARREGWEWAQHASFWIAEHKKKNKRVVRQNVDEKAFLQIVLWDKEA